MPYVKNVREAKGFGCEQHVLLTMDVITGYRSAEVKQIFQKFNLLTTNVLVNKTHYFQLLDLNASGSSKGFISKKFKTWYSNKIGKEMEKEKFLEEIDG